MAGPGRFVRELRRRRVFRVAAIYIVSAWVAVQVASEVFPGLGIPEAAIRFVWLGAILGFPLALVFGWFYDITSQGLVRTPPADPAGESDLSLHKADYVILAALAAVAVGIAYPLTEQIRLSGPLEFVEVPVPVIHPNSIAVLPLDNLSGDPDQAYFVEGMHEALIQSLSNISGLAVISRTSTRRFAEPDRSLRTIGQQLGAAKIVEGSVYQVADRVRITIQLIEAETDKHVWAESYDRELKDILRMQNEVARDIARQIEIQLTPEETARLANVREINPAAHEAYLRGRFHADRFTPEDARMAFGYYRAALDIDPDYALPYLGIASYWGQNLVAGVVPPLEAGPKWQAAVLRAVELDPDLAEVQHGLANMKTWWEWDWVAAEAAFKRSIALNPSNARTRVFYSHFLTCMGRYEEATEEVERALELDPLNSFFRALYATQLSLSKQLDEAIAEFRKIYARDPGLGFGHEVFSDVLYRTGMYEEALDQTRIAFSVHGDREAIEVLDRGYAEAGFERAMLRVAELLESRSRTMFVKPMDIAFFYDYAGDTEKVFDWLEQAYQLRDHDMVYLAAGMAFSDPVQTDTRFKELLDRMNLPH